MQVQASGDVLRNPYTTLVSAPFPPAWMTLMNAIICSILVLAAIGWVLCVNADDRRLFEKELDDMPADDPDS